MFCPRCGQRQFSSELRFCSQCGMPLNVVAEVVAGGGTLPHLLEENPQGKKKIFSRRNGLILSLFWFLFFVLLATPFFGIIGADELAGMSAILGVFGGLLIMLASLFFLDNKRKPYEQSNFQSRNLSGSVSNQNVLPPQQAVPTSAYVPPMNSWKAPDTGDLARPGSVTENTTKLLQKDE